MKSRMYFLVNQYILGIQAGIQAGHAAVELLNDYRDASPNLCLKKRLIDDWADNHKTFILLEGGYQQRMYDFVEDVLSPVDKIIPYTTFKEEVDALNGALTAVAFVLPEYIYNCKVFDDGTVPLHYSHPETFSIAKFTQQERTLISELKKFRLKGG